MHRTQPDRPRPAVAVKAVVIPCTPRTPRPCRHRFIYNLVVGYGFADHLFFFLEFFKPVLHDNNLGLILTNSLHNDKMIAIRHNIIHSVGPLDQLGI